MESFVHDDFNFENLAIIAMMFIRMGVTPSVIGIANNFQLHLPGLHVSQRQQLGK